MYEFIVTIVLYIILVCVVLYQNTLIINLQDDYVSLSRRVDSLTIEELDSDCSSEKDLEFCKTDSSTDCKDSQKCPCPESVDCSTDCKDTCKDSQKCPCPPKSSPFLSETPEGLIDETAEVLDDTSSESGSQSSAHTSSESLAE
jgi:hypothetical protein